MSVEGLLKTDQFPIELGQFQMILYSKFQPLRVAFINVGLFAIYSRRIRQNHSSLEHNVLLPPDKRNCIGEQVGTSFAQKFRRQTLQN